MKKDSTGYKVVLLGVLCAVCGLVLSLVNGLTAPVIEKAALANVIASLEEIYPGAEFKEVKDFNDDTNAIESIYEAEGEGLIYKCKVTGYNADGFTFLIAFNNDGTVGGFIPLEQNETAGFGQRCFEDEYVESIEKLTSSDAVPLLSGATLTSTAIEKGIDAAKAHFNSANGISYDANKKAEPVKKEAKKLALNDAYDESKVEIEEISNDGKEAVYHATARGFGLVDPNGIASASGHEYSRNEADITVDLENKTIVSIELTHFGDTEGVGTPATSEDALKQYVGASIDSEVDATTNATFTSTSIAAMAHAALDAASK